MRPTISREEIMQIELALERSQAYDSVRGLATIFWGLIIAKCFLAQWAVLTYDVPINALVFVWLPSLIFGGLCTLVYISMAFRRFKIRNLAGRFVRHIWGACFGVISLLTVLGAGLDRFNPFLLPGFFALVLGTGFYIHSTLEKRATFKWAAAGWWLSSGWLFYEPNTNALGWFSLCILLFQVAPSVTLYCIDRKRHQKQMHPLPLLTAAHSPEEHIRPPR